ncbi:MAG: hypothetical protein NTW21_20375, partial [Verrucomicrobia bacterium]|nr:hypothetical protein [Verrucomicrobiota bacterium]
MARACGMQKELAPSPANSEEPWPNISDRMTVPAPHGVCQVIFREALPIPCQFKVQPRKCEILQQAPGGGVVDGRGA